MLAGRLQDTGLNVQHQRATLTREQLNLVLGRLVGSEQSVLLVVAASVDRGGQDIVQPADQPRTRIAQDTLGTRPGMDVAGQHGIGVVQDRARLIGEHDLYVSTGVTDQIGVITYVIHARELMRIGAEQLTIALQRQNVGVGVNARRVNLIPSDQLVPDLVRGIGKHQHDLTATLGDAAPRSRTQPAG